MPSQAKRLQTVRQRKRKRAPSIEEPPLSVKEPKIRKKKKNEEVTVWYGFECKHCPKDDSEDTEEPDKQLQRLCICKKKTYDSDRKVGYHNFPCNMSNIDTYIFLIAIKSNISSHPRAIKEALKSFKNSFLFQASASCQGRIIVSYSPTRN